MKKTIIVMPVANEEQTMGSVIEQILALPYDNLHLYPIIDNYSKDINFWLSGGALKVNLWHGVGNKCINYDNLHDCVRHPKDTWERFKYFPRRLSDEKPSHYIFQLPL